MSAETILLGPSDLRVSRLGFGCWQLGGHGWQDIDQRAIAQAVEEALARGVNFFDTADVYGLGESETLLGRALGKRGIVATKFGVRRAGEQTVYDNSRAWITQAVEASLARLGRETIDLYQLHRHDGKRPLADICQDLEALRSQGKIRWYGISNLSPELLAARPAGLVSFTLEYSLVRREWEAAIRQAKNMGFIAWGALTQGLLSGKYAPGHVFAPDDIRSHPDSLFAPARWEAYTPVLNALKTIAAEHGHSQSQTALRWVLDTCPGSVVLAGIKNARQLEENAGALGWRLSADALRALSEVA